MPCGKKKTALAERIDAKLRAMKLHTGPDEWDPVELIAVLAADYYKKGDDAAALACLREVAPYVRPKLRPKDVSDEDSDQLAIDAEERAKELAVRLGLREGKRIPAPPSPPAPRIAIFREDDAIRGIEDAEVIEE